MICAEILEDFQVRQDGLSESVLVVREQPKGTEEVTHLPKVIGQASLPGCYLIWVCSYLTDVHGL